VAWEDHSEWRRLRLYVSGDICRFLEFKIEADFKEPVKVRDLYVRVKDLPLVGNVTIGHFKEPFGLEMLTGSANTTFMERGLSNVFSPGYNFGVMMNNSLLDERATWALGMFKNFAEDYWGSTSQGNACAVTGRVTCLPWYEDNGAKLFHLGGDYSFRDPHDAITFSQRPEAYFVDQFTKTGSIDANRLQLFGVEAAWVYQAFSLQSQYQAAAMDASGKGDLYLDGLYVEASCFLTGEHRPYNRASGAFESVKPNKDFLARGGGLGAWQVATRYSFLDFDRGNLPASATNVQDFTVGLNWYLNSYLRIDWNYIHSWVAGPDSSSGAADIFMMRLQAVF
jgi:phosphate-selective porin OprO/OprP